MAYTPKTPSIATTIASSVAPSGWKFMGMAVREEVPRRPQAAMDGPVTIVGLPSVVYSLSYLTLDPIAAGDVLLEECTGATTLTIDAITMDNPYLIGGQLTFQDTGRGIIAVNYTQDIACLSQRFAYV